MHRLVIFVTIIAIALAGRVITPIAPVSAASEIGPVSGEHPIVGAWYWENISDDFFDDSYAVFGSEGTYVEETSFIGAGIGFWQATGDDSLDLIIVYQDVEGGLDPNQPEAFVAGTLKMWLSIEVAADGNHLTASGPVEARRADGTLAYAYTFSGTATRMGLEWVQPVATPTA